MHHEFPASDHDQLFVEIQSGDVRVEAVPEGLLVVDVEGDEADEVAVERRDGVVAVIGPRRTGFLGRSRPLHVRVRVPEGTDVATRLGSADLEARGPLGTVEANAGSGDVRLEEVRGQLAVRTGSGDVRVVAAGQDVEVKTGSGDIDLREVAGSGRVLTGSGEVAIGHVTGAVQVKSGSGDLTVTAAEGDASLTTASGDVRIDRLGGGRASLKNASGDIRVGVPEGVPVWTDVSTTTGRVHTDLPSVGAPRDGQQHVEVRAQSVTGDIYLTTAS